MPSSGSRSSAPPAFPRSSTARYPMLRTAIPCLGRCQACPTRSKPASSPSASPRPVAPARFWPNGSRKARPNGTCGPATRAASPRSDRHRTMPSPRAWKSMATNMPSTSRVMPGLRYATASFRRCMNASRPWEPSSAPIMAGNARPGTQSPATTSRNNRHKPLPAPGPGSLAFARNAWPYAMPPVFSTCLASAVSD